MNKNPTSFKSHLNKYIFTMRYHRKSKEEYNMSRYLETLKKKHDWKKNTSQNSLKTETPYQHDQDQIMMGYLPAGD